MKKIMIVSICIASAFMFTSCKDETKKDEPAALPTGPAKPVVVEAAKPDMAQIRSEITAIENAWAEAINKKDVNALMALYGDGAQSMQDGGPTLVADQACAGYR